MRLTDYQWYVLRNDHQFEGGMSGAAGDQIGELIDRGLLAATTKEVTITITTLRATDAGRALLQDTRDD